MANLILTRWYVQNVWVIIILIQLAKNVCHLTLNPIPKQNKTIIRI